MREFPISIALLLVPVLLGLSACSSPPVILPSSPPSAPTYRPYVVDATGLYLKGMQYEDQGVVDSAAFFYHHALMVHDDPWLRFSLARCLDAMSLQDVALAFLRPIASLPDPPAEPALMLAELYMNQDEMDSAAILLRRFPTHPTARAMLADAILQEQPATARDLYRELLAEDPESDNLAVGLVMAHVLLGTCDSAVKEARGLEKRNPGQRNTAVLLALSLACVGDTSEALAIYEERLADAPPSAEHVMEFVTMCRNRGEPIRALQLLERANADPEQEDLDALHYL